MDNYKQIHTEVLKSKYNIVMLVDQKFPDYLDQVQCVPHLWITASSEPGFVNVSYPTHDIEIEMIFKKVDDFPSVNWSFYQAKMLHSTNNAKEAAEKLQLYRTTNNKLQITIKTEPKKRKLEDNPGCSKSFSTPPKSNREDVIVLADTYHAPPLTGFQDMNESKLNTTITLTDDEEDEQNENKTNVSTVFKELRARLLLTLQELQTQIDPDFKETDCEDEATNQLSLKGIVSSSEHINFKEPGPNVVELMPDTGVYVQKLRLDFIETLNEPKQIISVLLKAIFSEDSLEVFGISQLNQHALFVLYLFMMQKYGVNMEETREGVIKFLKINKRNKAAKPRVSIL